MIYGSIYIGLMAVISAASYGYADPHLLTQLPYIAYWHRPLATVLFFVFLLLLFALYFYFITHPPKIWVIIVSAFVLAFSYPALSYDLFNYITTAKVLYTHHENPYIVMPIEIPNEPYLAFTRAANKTALYGPVWLAISAIPHFLGGGNIWATVFAFKFMNVLAYFGFAYIVWKKTKNLNNVLFFAINPLVLIEVIMNGHNDIYMMVLALAGGYIGLVASWFVKGATLPLLFVAKKTLVWWYWVLAAVFFILAPIREELYPWYAVWLITTAALLPAKNNRFIHWFTVALSFALELRYLPYLWMGYYEGPGPALRLLLTVVPVAVFLFWYLWKKPKQQLFS